MHLLGFLQARSQGSSPLLAYGFMAFMVLIFWFVVMRPAQKQRQQQDAMRAALEPGDRVRMNGGMYGTVGRIKDDRVFVKIATGVEVEFARQAVSEVVNSKDE
jgi:preprotein translocase subunit YajC